MSRFGFGSLAKQPIAETKWWTPDTVAVVTGANKGIGYEIARQLAEQGLTTVVTARDANKGVKSMQEMKEKLGENANLVFHQLDITDSSSVSSFSQWLKDSYGGCTVLVNNAGIAYKGSTFGAEEAQATIATNYHGTKNVCEALKPLLKKDARIVNVCSVSGLLRQISSPQLKQRLTDPQSTADIDKLGAEFVQAIRDGTHREQGWSNSMYGISKVLEISYTLFLAKDLSNQGVMVSACCPGYVATDMSSWRGTKTWAQGADTPVWLALQPPGSMSGGFYQERSLLQW